MNKTHVSYHFHWIRNKLIPTSVNGSRDVYHTGNFYSSFKPGVNSANGLGSKNKHAYEMFMTSSRIWDLFGRCSKLKIIRPANIIDYEPSRGPGVFWKNGVRANMVARQPKFPRLAVKYSVSNAPRCNESMDFLFIKIYQARPCASAPGIRAACLIPTRA